jgi:hypothetical protein
MKVLPLIYYDALSDEEIARHDCSDRLFVGARTFERMTALSGPGVATIVLLENAVTQSAPALVYGAHSSAEDIVYAPAWILAELLYDTENVRLSPVTPDLCRKITLVPHTSAHLHGPTDPETLLRDAFEQYTCLVPGLDYDLWLGGHAMTVTLTVVEPLDRPYVCIRGNELMLELLAPLDRPATPPPVPVPAPAPVPAPVPVTAPTLSPAELRAHIAAAARARMAAVLSTPDNSS